MNKEDEKSLLTKFLSTTATSFQASTGRIYPRPKLIALIFVTALIVYCFPFAKPTGSSERSTGSTDTDSFYAVIFDAGSTGSRIHVYKFTRNNGKLELLNELFQQVKPGLSSYADDIDGGMESIANLMQYAKDTIPEEKWKDTPMELKATAGLRLLPEGKADGILDGVTRLFDESPFKVGENAVEIMAGNDEGINGWMTVNFLLGSLGGSGLANTIPTIDLGGGSMQLTFHPKNSDTSKSAPEGYMVTGDAFGDNFPIYTHSYLGLGLMSSRELLFGGPSEDNELITTESACFNTDRTIDWSNAGHNYFISGTGANFENCLDAAKAAVSKISIDNPQEITGGVIFAFSYFFDKAVAVGLIEEEEGGKTTVGAFHQAGYTVCDKVQEDEWLCTDISIICALLDAFGLPETQTLQISQKINGAETQWTLGDAFHLM